jgi:hypothetical protein
MRLKIADVAERWLDASTSASTPRARNVAISWRSMSAFSSEEEIATA